MTISTTGFKGSSKKKLYTLMATVALTTMGGVALNVVAPTTANAAIVTNSQGQQVDDAGADIYVKNGATAIDGMQVHFNEVPVNLKETIQVSVPYVSGYTVNKSIVNITKYGSDFYLITTDGDPLRYTSIYGDNASDGSEQLTQTEGGYLDCIVGPQGMYDDVYVSDNLTTFGETAFVKVPQKAGYTANYDTIEIVYIDNIAGHRAYTKVGDDFLVYTLNDDSSSNANAGSSSTGTDTNGSSSSSNALTSTDKNNAKDSSSKADSKTPAASTTASATKTSSAKADVQTGVADGMLPTIAAGASSVIAALGLAIRKHF